MFVHWIRNITRRRLFLFAVLAVVGLFATEAIAGQNPSFKELDRLGREALRNSEYPKASLYFQQQLDLATDGAADSDLVLALGNLAEARRLQGWYDDAEKLFDRALRILESSAAVDQRALPVVLTNLGRLYQLTGRPDLSESFLKRALKIEQRKPSDQLMVQTLNALGVVYATTRRHKTAETTFKRSIALADQLNLQDVVVSIALGNLANVYEQKGQWKRAAPLHDRALRIVEAAYGVDHPLTLVVQCQRGLSYYFQGKLPDAEANLRHVLEARSRTQAPPDSTEAIASYGLALVLTARGNYEDAKSRLKASLEIEEQNPGSKSLEVAMILDELARLTRKMNNPEEAAALEQRARRIRAEKRLVFKPQP
jgi:tetratricopeptide (TPR) repeat protein